jgi:hypothetical protein
MRRSVDAGYLPQSELPWWVTAPPQPSAGAGEPTGPGGYDPGSS